MKQFIISEQQLGSLKAFIQKGTFPFSVEIIATNINYLDSLPELGDKDEKPTEKKDVGKKTDK